uniref:Large ribosomal subunit protein bL25 n=1 Tax=uncultured Nocardioidaceae bacterium TaxID=253824 RepID=A0A6J4MMZ1_9ACTN|nr:MAG: LSU ribosomal protein L25p [uncultured Nocardioidaceae bacterium]
MSEIKIQAEPRTEFGKGAARRIRRANRVPAVLYGHGTDPVHVTLPGHDLMLALKSGANALLSIDVAGGASELALPKQVQRDPIKGFIEHADLILVRRGEKVTVDVPVVLTGEATPETLVVTELNTLSVEAEATHLPESIEVSIEGLAVGDQILASDVKLPEGTTLVVDPTHLVVIGSAAPTAEQLDAAMADAEAEAGIERDESDADVELASVEAAEAAEEPSGDRAPDEE